MKKLLSYSLAAIGAILIQSTAFAQLLVTEINSNNSVSDFFEITNFGSISIDLFSGSTPFTWNDNNPDSPMTLPLGISIAPGESIIFLANSSNVAAFRTSWNLSASVQVIGDTSATGLGSGDSVTLYGAGGETLASLSYATGGFIRSNGTSPTTDGHAGVAAGGIATQSLIWDPTSGMTPSTARYTFANGTNFGSYASSGTGVGSPGIAAVPEPSTYMLMGAGLSALVILARRRRAAN